MASLKGRAASPKCKCCPYGFHIDLDFVKFAENVANGNAQKQNGERRSLRKVSKRQSSSGVDSQPANRTLMSPLESIFSDSLENIVSDFEETLNPRDYASDREAVVRGVDNVQRSNGYVSDYGPHFTRSFQSPAAQSSSYFRSGIDDDDTRMNLSLRNGYHSSGYSARKPPAVPASGSVSQAYCTALGRTISEIKAKQDREADERQRLETRRNITAAYRKREELMRPKDLGLRNPYPTEHTPYEQGKVHFLGSKTPEVSRANYASSSYQSDTEEASSWRRRLPVQRSSSAVDVDGFVSERRRKLEELSSSLDAAKTTYPDWRHITSHQTSSYNSLPPKRDSESFRLRVNGTPVTPVTPASPLPSIRSQLASVTPRPQTSESLYSTLPKRESSSVSSVDRYKSLTSVGTSTPPMPPSKPCSECPLLREQLLDLSTRLAAMESSRDSKLFEERGSETERTTLQNTGTDPLSKCFVNKKTGESAPSKLSVAISTTPVRCVDFAGDAVGVDSANKDTSTSYADRCALGQLRDASNSPLSPPRRISFGVVTDQTLALTTPSCSDASTNTLLDLTVLLENYQDGISRERAAGVGNLNDKTNVKDGVCETVRKASTKEEGTSTDFLQPLVISRSVGPNASMALKDVGSMTFSAALWSHHVQTDRVPTRSVYAETDSREFVDRGVDPIQNCTKDSSTSYDLMSGPSTSNTVSRTTGVSSAKASEVRVECAATQTDFEIREYDSEPRVLSDSEIAESLWLMPSKDSCDVAVGNDDDFAVDYDDVVIRENNNVYYGDDEDKKAGDNNDDEDVISITEETISDQEASGMNESVEESADGRQEADDLEELDDKPRALGQERAAIVRKLLTETKIPQPQTSFVRGTAASRSCRVESKKGDSLEYITDQYNVQNGSTPSTPQTQKGALKEKVVLKKEPVAIPSKVPDPIPARIPRPKIAKYSPIVAEAQSPDEEAEVADRLTPLRSEMRTLRTFSNGRSIPVSRISPPTAPVQAQSDAAYDNPAVEDDSTSSDSEGSYDTNEIKSAGSPPPFEISKQLKEALDLLRHNFDNLPVDPSAVDWAHKYVQHEWLKTAARRTALAQQVEGFIDALDNCCTKVLTLVVNMTDQNENTALHYAVSHGNFDVVSVILDSRVCNLDKANRAGYTAVMLAALCEITDEMESTVVRRLFQMGNVNAKAAQHGQTALMLAVSHGKMDTTRLLLQCGADLNMQDEEGSTALMCAAEHGHKEIVKLLLAQPGIDASISDCDSSTALSIAVENRHRDIGVLIYAHLNYARNEQTPHHDSNTSTSVH